MIFTSAQRKAITRRIIKIDIENIAYTQSVANSVLAENIYNEVDGGNKVFFDNWNSIIYSYLSERQNISGNGYATFTETDLVNAAAEATSNLFFPNSGALSPYVRMNPEINSYVDGSISGSISNYESLYLSYIYGSLAILLAGFTPTTPPAATKQLQAQYNVGAGSVIVNGNTFNPGDFLICESTAPEGAIFFINSGPTGGGPNYTYTVTEVCISGNILNGTSVTNSFSGYTNAQRQTLSGSSYDKALVALADKIKLYVYNNTNDLESTLGLELADLSNNVDSRFPQESQNTDAISNINTALSTITTWKGKSDTGADGKFIDANINTISALYTSRNSQCASRLTKISAALGTITQGSSSFSGSGALYEHYIWVDKRINRQYGSLRAMSKQQQTQGFLQGMIDNNTSSLTRYEEQFLMSRIIEDLQIGSNLIKIEDATGFNVGDSAYLTDESQNEYPIIIEGVNYINNEIYIKVATITVFLISQLGRVYKQL